MYGQSPYGNIMGRGMFMQPQMQQMLQMRDQMRRPQAVQDMQMQLPEMQQTTIDEQMNSPRYQALLQRNSDSMGQDYEASEQLNEYTQRFGQMQPQQQTTEQTLEQLQSNMQMMQQQQQQLSQHLGAGSGMLQQQYQGGLGGLFQGNLTNQPVQHQMARTQGPDSRRLRTQGPTNTMYQGNPFGA